MWDVVLLEEVETWFLDLVRADSDVAISVVAAIDMLEENGPMLGRPLVDRIKGSSTHNMKELRPSSTNVRILFVFDPDRHAVLLVAGDKTGDWRGWYTTNVPVAEERYEGWLNNHHRKDP